MLGLGWTLARGAGKLGAVCDASNAGCPSCGASIESGAPHGQSCRLMAVCPGCRDGVGCLFPTECAWPAGVERPERRPLPAERAETYEQRLERLGLRSRRLPTYEDFLAGRFGTPWTVELGRLWGSYVERQAREARR